MITVVGGSGFIGSRLCLRLRDKGERFLIIDKAQSALFPEKTLITDIRSPIEQPKTLPQTSALINLAAEHRDDVRPVSLYDEVNVIGAKNICKLAKQKGINKIIFTSSVAVYGFAPIGTNELGKIAPFNDYGRTKWEAEQVYKEWQKEDQKNRTLVIVRPTVVFGERNRGNVYNLLKQIASGRFVMIGTGLNRKSMAYVENLAAFIEYSLEFEPGIHIHNYIDKPDFTMIELVSLVNKLLGKKTLVNLKMPFTLGLLIGKFFDLTSNISGRKFSISAIRVKKFCANSIYESNIELTGFTPPIPLIDAIQKTIQFEFIEDHKSESVFYSE